MRIIFDVRSTGLGDNGGSSTIINSANILSDLGNEVFIISSMKNYHTWVKLNTPHIIIDNKSKLPDSDFIIATGYKSVKHTLSSPSRCGIKFHWIRGWELWRMTEKEIIKKILNVPTIKLVNGICLQKKLQTYNCPSYIIRPGYDTEKLKPLNIRESNEKIILGGLYNQDRGKQQKRTAWLFETLFQINSRRRDIEFWLFGSHPDPKRIIVNNYLQKPTMEEKNIFYNNINIWLAPTALEGLHMPPAEAMLTECPVIGTDARMNGMKDYLINMKTGLVSPNKLQSFIETVRSLINDKPLQIQLGKQAREMILSLGNRKENMIKLIKLLKRLRDENI